MPVYYDTEHDIIITEAELRQDYDLSCDLMLGFKDEYPSFNAWLKECCYKNGTLERIYE